MRPLGGPPDEPVSSPSGAAQHIINLIAQMQVDAGNARAGAGTSGDTDGRREAERRSAALADVSRIDLLNGDTGVLDTTFPSAQEFLAALLQKLQFCEEGVAHSLISYIQSTLGVTTALLSPRELAYEKRVRYLASVTTLGEEDIRNRLGNGVLSEAAENQRTCEIEAQFERLDLRATGS